MPQAAALASANYIYVRAPRDGSVLGSISRNLPSQAVMKLPNIEADARRYNWLGGTSFPGRICAVTAAAPVQNIDDLFKQELLVGSVGVGSSTSIVPTVINKVVGTKFHLVEGYRGAGDIILAMQRGEVQGGCMSYGQFRSHEQLFKEGKFKIILRAEESEMAEAPGVPSIFDYAKTEEQRQLMRFIFSSTEFGRPYIFPPDVPKDRVRVHARGDRCGGEESRNARRGGQEQARHDLPPAGAPGEAGQSALRDAAGADRAAQEHQPEFALGNCPAVHPIRHHRVTPDRAAVFGAAGSSRRRRR